MKKQTDVEWIEQIKEEGFLGDALHYLERGGAKPPLSRFRDRGEKRLKNQLIHLRRSDKGREFISGLKNYIRQKRNSIKRKANGFSRKTFKLSNKTCDEIENCSKKWDMTESSFIEQLVQDVLNNYRYESSSKKNRINRPEMKKDYPLFEEGSDPKGFKYPDLEVIEVPPIKIGPTSDDHDDGED